jgi:hypothetical protein
VSWFTKKTPVVVMPEKGPEATVEQVGWISVKDQIPEFGVRVLAACAEYGVITGHRSREDGEGHTWTLGCLTSGPYALYAYLASSKKVTHWMPMPPGPLS